MGRSDARSLVLLGLLGPAFFASFACSSARHLETRLGGRAMDDLRAEAQKVDGRWQVELLLPAGTWTVEPQEGQACDLLPHEPRATLRWKVAPDRWAQQDRPFRFDLVGESGLRLSFSVIYPNSLPGGSAMLDVWRVLSGGK